MAPVTRKISLDDDFPCHQEIANDFIRLGFLRPGTDVSEIVPAMETIWAAGDSTRTDAPVGR